MSFPIDHFPDLHFPDAHFPHEYVPVVVIPQGGGGGKKRKVSKSWDQRERERLEQLRKDEAQRNKDKYGDMPKGLEDALKAAPSPYKRLSPQAVKAYQAARQQDDEDAFALIAGLL